MLFGRWLLRLDCVCELWKSGDDDDVVEGDGVGVGGGAIGDEPQVWMFSNGFLSDEVSVPPPPLGKEPYARNILA